MGAFYIFNQAVSFVISAIVRDTYYCLLWYTYITKKTLMLYIIVKVTVRIKYCVRLELTNKCLTIRLI